MGTWEVKKELPKGYYVYRVHVKYGKILKQKPAGARQRTAAHLDVENSLPVQHSDNFTNCACRYNYKSHISHLMMSMQYIEHPA